MTRQEQQLDHGGLTIPAFADFSGKPLHNARFRNAVFEGKVNFQKAKFTGTADFSGAKFLGPSDFTGASFDADLLFDGATTREPIKFNEVVFNGRAEFAAVRFSHDAHFSHVTFSREANFRNTEFHAWGRFDSTHFTSSANFNESTFFGSANFTDTDFAGIADFTQTRFITYADFPKARFQDIAQFGNARLECKTIFREAEFLKDANFTDCRFTHPVNFASAKFGAAATFDRVIFLQFVDFSKTQLTDSFLLAPPHGAEGLAPEIRFESVALDHPERVRFSNISFEKITLMGTHLRGIRFEGPRWPKRGLLRKRSVVYDEIQKEKPDPDKLAELYRDIRTNLRQAGNTSDCGDLFYSEMEVRRKQRRTGPDSLYFFRRYCSPYTLFWLTCGYGRRPWRAVTTAAILGFLYWAR